MEGTKSESWSMKKIATALQEKEIDNVKIEVPTFQRNIVWSATQKETFIDSVKKGFPVGTLLFYKRKDRDTYSLIDGLQRSSTIRDFITFPTHYFSTEDISEEILEELYNVFKIKAVKKDFYDRVSAEIKKFMSEQTDLNGMMLLMDLAELLIDKYSNVEKDSALVRLVSQKIEPTIAGFRNLYNDIAESVMPILVFTGDENFLPTVFERINNQGTQLSKYQIYAASWAVRNYTVKVENDDIIKHIVAKYDAFTDAGYVLQDYDRDEMLETKVVNIFEYVLGFGKYISEKYPTLFVADKSVQTINQIGFELLNACFGHHDKDIKFLDEEIHKIDDLNTFQKCVEDAIVWVLNTLKPIIEFKCNRRDTIAYYHSHFQIISMIASIFREKYNVENLPYENADWKQKEEILVKTIPQYYVYDILTRVWTESGQGKIYSILNDNKYLIRLEKDLWETKLDDWFNTMITYREKKQVPNPKALDKLFLSCIYMKRFSSWDQLSVDKFDIEHLAPKNLLKKLIKKHSWVGLPISCIGNLCLLPEYDNRLKKDNTIYKDEKYISYLESKSVTLQMIEEKYSFTEEEDLSWCYKDYKEEDYEEVRESYIDFLRKHFNKMREEFYSAMEIS